MKEVVRVRRVILGRRGGFIDNLLHLVTHLVTHVVMNDATQAAGGCRGLPPRED
jgi:hypothetical protein